MSIRIKTFVIILISAVIALPISAKEWDEPVLPKDETPIIVDENKMTITVTINSIIKVELKDIPTTGNLEVYSILGERVKRLDLKKCKEGCSIDISNGLYIFKAGKITRKVIVK